MLEIAAERGLALGALGGVAIQLLCASARPGSGWFRQIADIDLATTLRHKSRVEELILEHDFQADEHFNRMNGSTRLRYLEPDGTHLDVFVDELRLCHTIAWRASLQPGMRTLPLPALLLTKLQIADAEPKDDSDLSALLTDAWQDLRDRWGELEQMVAGDWGLWRTGRSNLERLAGSPDPVVSARAGELLRDWLDVRHTLKARLRGRIGDRVRWHEEPEEV